MRVASAALLALVAPSAMGLTMTSTCGRRATPPRMAALSKGDAVTVVGAGSVSLLAAKLAALRGFETTCAVPDTELKQSKSLVYTDTTPEGSIPLTVRDLGSSGALATGPPRPCPADLVAALDPPQFMAISGPSASEEVVEACTSATKGLIIAFDTEQTMPQAALNIFMPEGGNLKRVAAMSRYLNGGGMGFFASAAKAAANAEIWAASGDAVARYKAMESQVSSRAAALGAEHTFIRAGTLKGGGIGSSDSGGSGDPSFLAPGVYNIGQQDVVNWRMLFDCDNLGAKLVRGDTLPGPGFTAALTATGAGDGDSGRGAVAAALVASLLAPEAANTDFSVGSVPASVAPTPDEWAAMFKAA